MGMFKIERVFFKQKTEPTVYLRDIKDFNDHIFNMCHKDGWNKKKTYVNSKFFCTKENIEIDVRSKSREWIYNGLRVMHVLNKELTIDTEKKRYARFSINFKEEKIEIEAFYGEKDKDGFELKSKTEIWYHRVFSDDI